MFNIFKKSRAKGELDAIIYRIESNMANNYKDAAQDAFKEFEVKFNEMAADGRLSDKQRINYEVKLSGYKTKLQGFTHKDQKATWT
ncbi:MAG: hypothetical protein E7261_07600 [Lachnospiraceae bacterium]|nr:hypothetical protein [Lachnospiraceae bacterium]